jgi:hypothetical protein
MYDNFFLLTIADVLMVGVSTSVRQQGRPYRHREDAGRSCISLIEP